MLDKTAYKILGVIASMSADVVNLVVSKSELISLVDIGLTVDELDKIIEALEVNDMLSVLYSDDNTYCIAIRPKGKLIAEKNQRAEEAALAAAAEEKRLAEEERLITVEEETLREETEKQHTFTVVDVRRFAIICAVSSFLGGFIAAMVTFVVTNLFK